MTWSRPGWPPTRRRTGSTILLAHDVWTAPVQDYDTLVDDPQLRHNGLLWDVPVGAGTATGDGADLPDRRLADRAVAHAGPRPPWRASPRRAHRGRPRRPGRRLAALDAWTTDRMTIGDPTTPTFETLDELAAHVRDGMTLAVGGTLFTRMPVRLLAAVCDARPRDLHYACWGGGLPLEMLLEAGAVTKATLCFSSLDIFGQARRFQAAVQDGRLELVEWTAHAFAQALFAGKRRLPSEPFTWPAGSDLADLPTFPSSVADPVSGTRIGAAPALRPDVLLLHAPAADEDGNIVLVGARAMELVMIPASRQVLVTVDAVVSRDELRRIPAGIVISRHFVTAIAVVPGAATPTSSLPYYLADFDRPPRMDRGR